MNKQLFQELREATADFGEAYDLAAQGKKLSETNKASFYDLADQALADERLPQKTIEIPLDYHGTIAEFVAAYYPAWRVLRFQLISDEAPVEALIEKDPAKMKFTFTNPKDKKTYQRSYQEGHASIDIDRLRDEDPDLWLEISAWPSAPHLLGDYLKYLFPESRIDIDFDKFLDEHGERLGVERILRPSSEWSEKQAGALQKYAVPGKLTMMIVKPRQATEEELEALEELMKGLE